MGEAEAFRNRLIAVSIASTFAGVGRRAADAVLAVLMAPRCAACDHLLDTPTRGPVCASCWGAIRPLTPPLCDGCGDPLPSWRTFSRDSALCPRCRRAPRAIDRGRAIGQYAGALRQIIHALKYDKRQSVAPRLAALMRARASDVLEGADLVVPVPLHRRRKRERGFNQAAEIAAHLGLPVVEALQRIRPTVAQVSLPASQRHRNVRRAFALGRGGATDDVRLRGARVVLIDDVSTTGATLEACARALKAGGVLEVRALTAARVVRARP